MNVYKTNKLAYIVTGISK